MSDHSDGGCQCGRLRYRIHGAPRAAVACHCTECQKQSGSAFGISLIVDRDRFELLSGEPKIYTRNADSGNRVHCAFCGECGNRIYHSPEKLPDTYNVKPGTLDDTSALKPVMHVWTASRQPWVPIPDGVRCFEQNPG